MSIIEHNTIPRGDYAAIVGQVTELRPANTNVPQDPAGLALTSASPGTRMMALATRLYPICRSLTGPGVRETLEILQAQIPLTIHNVASGTQVFDWTVPDEWTLREAFIANATGEKVVDMWDPLESTCRHASLSIL